MKVRESLNWATEFLERYGVDDSRRNSELLLGHLLECRSTELYLSAASLDHAQVDELTQLLDKRKEGLPIQYIVGTAEFMGLEFIVNPAVFIPRPETELLVETVLNIVVPRWEKKYDIRHTIYDIRILDIGTGSGNIAISLTKNLSRCKIIATDVSGKALKVALKNAQLHKLQERITFFEGDLFELKSFAEKKPNFELIVCNPPYIISSQLRSLPIEVKYEPEVALDGGDDGLDYYRRIITKAPEYLVKGGYLIMEIGFGQLGKIKQIMGNLGQFKLAEVIKDYANIERVVVMQWIN